MEMSMQLPADDTAPARLAGPVNGRPLGHRIRVPKTAELVAADLRREIVRGELAEGDSLPSRARRCWRSGGPVGTWPACGRPWRRRSG
jgi:hypothetical protein